MTLHKKEVKTPDVVQPDLLVACDAKNAIDEKGRYDGVPTLAIEVLSPATRTTDMVDKLNTYMRSGVGEYWIVDPRLKRVLQYVFEELDIEAFEAYGLEDSFASTAFPGLEVQVAEIFQP